MKIFEFNKGQSGTLIDSVSKTAGSLTTGSGGFRKTERGQAMLFDGSATKIIYDGVASGTTFSFVSYIGKVKSTGTYQVIAGNNTNGAYFTSISDSDSLYFNNGTHAVTVANSGVLNSGKNHIVIVTVNGNQVSFYVDNIQIGTTQTISSIISIDLKSIGKRSTDLSFNGYIGLVRLYNTVLTTTQRNELYKEFLNSYGTEKQKRNFEYPKPTDLSSEVDSKVGTNLTDNYDFTSGWTDIAISSTTTNSFTTTSVGGLQKDILTIGKKYKIYYNATTTASDTGVNVGISEVCGNGEYAEFTATATALYVRNSNAGTTTVNNLTVQELTGLVAAYSFSPETVKGGEIVDISGNGNNGTISGALLTKDGMNIPYRKDISVTSYTMPSLEYTVCWKGKVNSITDSYCRILAFGSYIMFESTMNYLKIRTASDTLINLNTLLTTADFGKEFNFVYSRNTNTHNLYINGNLVETKEVVSNSIPSFTGFGNHSANSGDIILKDAKIYNYAFTPQQAKAYHNSFVKPTLIQDFSNYPVGSIANPQGTGVYTISERATGTSAIVPLGTKELTCGTAGTYSIVSKTSFGSWEFNVNKGADGNDLVLNILNNSTTSWNGGYSLYLASNESVRLVKTTTGVPTALAYSAASYIANNTDYRIKVARLKSEGVFKDIPTLQTSATESSSTYPYLTFTSNGRYGFSAISDGSGSQRAGTADELMIVNGGKYLIEFDLKLNSGISPTVSLMYSLIDIPRSNTVVPTNGRNSFILTSTVSAEGVLNFVNTSTATDYEVSGLTIRQIYDANSFAVFIKGGDFGNTETGWTLVSTTGGSGSNPVVDSTYTTSEYLVADLDASDKLSNIQIRNEVKQ